MYWEIIVALITGLCSVVAVAITNAKASRDMDAKLEKSQAVFEAHVTEQIQALTRRVEEHNQVVTRTYALERQVELNKAELSRHNERLKVVEKGG